MSRTVIQQLYDGDSGGGSAVGLGRCKGAESDEHSVIHGACIVEKSADDVLEMSQGSG